MTSPENHLSLNHIQCRYGDNTVVHNLSLEIKRGELVCLLGYSGCGKTTVLRAVAGFEPIHNGSIILNNNLLSSATEQIPAEKRNFGMVFQDYALFPHLNIEENVTFSLRKESRSVRHKQSEELLELVGLQGLGARHPHELSGGQQQRVALARALAQSPEVILMDEPFSNLDVELRQRLATEVCEILKTRGITGIMVTHDQHEAFAIADRIAVMHNGIIQQWDSGYNLYHKPANRFVAEFVGQGALLRGTVHGDGRLQTELGEIHGEERQALTDGCKVEMLVRPDDVTFDQEGRHEATIIRRNFLGAESLYTLQLTSGEEILGLIPSHLQEEVGKSVRFNLDMDNMIVFACNLDRAENMGTAHEH
ncbi:MAG: ABC transporter ATP-binding protein [Gammaproteobacteria bacterium]|jgi:iron(III) transport system ATP-binding protein|nr:ABC transporter ATP-binding protein [Gammaproteobacteria bacterium]MBT7915149.1 ABC transporter ATP-binding protein [Candidatus Bathyarchaeota archaeon]